MLFKTEIDIFLIEKFRYYSDNPCWSHGTTDESKNEKKIKKSALKKLEERNQANFSLPQVQKSKSARTRTRLN